MNFRKGEDVTAAPMMTSTQDQTFKKFLDDCLVEGLAKLLPEDYMQRLTFEDTQSVEMMFQSWMTVILLHSGDIEMRFTLHFELENVKELVEAAHGKPVEVFAQRGVVFDTLKEICNTVAGCLRNRLYQCNVESGFSLPMLLQGFDHVIVNRREGTSQAEYILIKGAGTRLLATYLVRFKDRTVLEQIDFSKMDDASLESGVIDLL